MERGDPRLAPFADLRAGDARSDDLCIVESRLAVEALLASPFEPVSLLVADRLEEPLRPLIDAFAGDVLIASQDVIDDTVGFPMHRGVVACARRRAPRSVEEVAEGAQRLLIVEGVNDAENLGALFRTAAAFGVDGVILDPTTCDPLGRRAIRVSMGHALRVPFARGPIRPMDGIALIALTPDATLDIAEVDTARFALLVGSEGQGLSEQARHNAQVCASIPMAEGVDSLNVATAAAVALALLRRRR